MDKTTARFLAQIPVRWEITKGRGLTAKAFRDKYCYHRCADGVGRGIRLDEWARHLVYSCLSNDGRAIQERVQLVCITPGDIKFTKKEKPNGHEVIDRATNGFGLRLLTVREVVQFRITYNDQPQDEVLFMGMQPMTRAILSHGEWWDDYGGRVLTVAHEPFFSEHFHVIGSVLASWRDECRLGRKWVFALPT